MNKLKAVWYLYKARKGTFDHDEFRQLCRQYAANYQGFSSVKDNHIEKILKLFFSKHRQELPLLNCVYENGVELQRFYLSCIPTEGRELSKIEESYLTSLMDFSFIDNFPRRVSDEAVNKLFETADQNRLCAYVRNFSLPEKYEMLLFRKYEREREVYLSPQLWEKVVDQYLSLCKDAICKTEAVQKILLEVLNDEQWEKICRRQSIELNLLCDGVVQGIVERGYVQAVRSLLLNSYINQSLFRFLLKQIPELKWELEISKVCRALYELQVKSGWKFGVLKPSAIEASVINGYFSHSSAVGLNNCSVDSGYFRNCIVPLLVSSKATPYFCRFVALTFKGSEEMAYKYLRKIAEKYVKMSRTG